MHRLSKLLRPHTNRVTSYLTDITDFLNHLALEVPENTLLVSFDVQSLYSNIPHKLGVEAFTYWLTKFPDGSPIRFSKEFILEGINFILNNNTFHFNGNYFRQTKGTAMGTKFAPVYPTLVMGYLEETLYEKLKIRFGHGFGNDFIQNWKRFLDDSFVPWIKSRSELLELKYILQ